MALRPAVFDRHILSLDVAGFAQSLAERVHKRCRKRAGRRGVEDPDHRHRLLLRLHSGRRKNEAESKHDREPDLRHWHLAWDGWRESSRTELWAVGGPLALIAGFA